MNYVAHRTLLSGRRGVGLGVCNDIAAAVISNGRNLMQSYAAQVDVPDRWAIVAYVRALQLARLGAVDDVPEADRATLPK